MSQENKDQRLSKKILWSLFLFHHIKIEQKILIFDDWCINKNAFHKNKKPISIDEVEMKKIVLLSIHLFQMNGYTIYFENNKYINLLAHNQKLLKE